MAPDRRGKPGVGGDLSRGVAFEEKGEGSGKGTRKRRWSSSLQVTDLVFRGFLRRARKFLFCYLTLGSCCRRAEVAVSSPSWRRGGGREEKEARDEGAAETSRDSEGPQRKRHKGPEAGGVGSLLHFPGTYQKTHSQPPAAG